MSTADEKDPTEMDAEELIAAAGETDPSEMDAEELISAGFYQTSSKTRSLARIPDGRPPLDVLREIAPRDYEHIMRNAENSARATLLRVYNRVMVTVEVSIETFAQFKKLGGPVA